MWETNLIDSVFSPNTQKKGGKTKKKIKDLKVPKIPQTPDKKADPRPKLEKTNETSDSKQKKKELKKKEAEERKVESNSIPLKQHNSVPVGRNIPQKESQQKQEHWTPKDQHYKSKKYNRKELSSEKIPQEAVSSFYQCDEEYSEPKYFEDAENFQRSNSYNYYQSNNDYMQNQQYMDNNMSYYQADQSMMHQQLDPTTQRQYE